MLSLLDNVAKFILGDDEEDEQAASSSASKENGPALSYLHLQKMEEKEYRGRVTNLHADHGLIDGEITFDRGKFDRKKTLRVGSKVTGRATRTNPSAGWRVATLNLVTNLGGAWAEDTTDESNEDSSSEDDQPLEAETCERDGGEASSNNEAEQRDDFAWKSQRKVGRVHHVNADGTGSIGPGIPFVKEVVHFGFDLKEGDWVNYQLEISDDQGKGRVEIVTSVEPVRCVNFEGTINFWNASRFQGFIDYKGKGDIIFFADAWAEKTSPRFGDPVKGKAVETRSHRSRAKNSWQWRAVVVNFNPDDRAQRKPHRNDFLKKALIDFDALCCAKEGVDVTGDLDFGIAFLGDPDFEPFNNRAPFNPNGGCDFDPSKDEADRQRVRGTFAPRPRPVWINNSGTMEQTLLKARLANVRGQVSQFGVQFPEGKSDAAQTIPPGGRINVNVTCTPLHMGKEERLLVFDFGKFEIAKSVCVNVKPPESYVYFHKLSPFQPFQRRNIEDSQERKEATLRLFGRDANNVVIPGERPRFSSKKERIIIQTPNKVPPFEIPHPLQEAVCNTHGDELLQEYPLLREELTPLNYLKKMHLLLFLEEIHCLIEMRQFDLFQSIMIPKGEFLALHVEGLSEGRPSLMLGDKAIASIPGSLDGPLYEGIIHRVTKDEIYLKFHPAFHSSFNSASFDIRFVESRMTMRRSHMAVNHGFKLGVDVLFPENLITRLPHVCSLRPTKNTSVGDRPSWIDQSECRDRILQSYHRVDAVVAPTTGSGEDEEMRFALLSACPDDVTELEMSFNFNAINSVYLPDFITPYTPSLGFERWLVTRVGLSTSEKYLSPLAVKETSKESASGSRFFFNRKLNERQKAAVERILKAIARPIPYVIYGPPGTGKSVTVCEAILQIFVCIGSSRILACTPSNAAADLLAERLHASGVLRQGDMVRFNAYNRDEATMPEIIADYCMTADEVEHVAYHKIILSTCSQVGQLYQLGLPSGHFTHIFVDEAGQAIEPEIMLPLGFAAGNSEAQIVLAGDPKQLGPVIMSKRANVYGLGLSFLERLTDLPIYSRNTEKFGDHGCYNPLVVTKLVDNYRSHPSLLKISSQLFYDDELHTKGPSSVVRRCLSWSGLPRRGFPFVFDGVRGEDVREGTSPSWFNPAEVFVVVKYVKLLLADEELRLDVEDLGVITPYRKQVEKIRNMLFEMKVDGIKVGSVEEFQGQERPVIIVSTVRAKESLVNYDERHNLGFLSNPKRFNVTITRAQSLLVVVGNPHLLCMDYCWKTLVRYAVDNGAYVGCELPFDLDDDPKEEPNELFPHPAVPESPNVPGDPEVVDSIVEIRPARFEPSIPLVRVKEAELKTLAVKSKNEATSDENDRVKPENMAYLKTNADKVETSTVTEKTSESPGKMEDACSYNLDSTLTFANGNYLGTPTVNGETGYEETSTGRLFDQNETGKLSTEINLCTESKLYYRSTPFKSNVNDNIPLTPYSCYGTPSNLSNLEDSFRTPEANNSLFVNKTSPESVSALPSPVPTTPLARYHPSTRLTDKGQIAASAPLPSPRKAARGAAKGIIHRISLSPVKKDPVSLLPSKFHDLGSPSASLQTEPLSVIDSPFKVSDLPLRKPAPTSAESDGSIPAMSDILERASVGKRRRAARGRGKRINFPSS